MLRTFSAGALSIAGGSDGVSSARSGEAGFDGSVAFFPVAAGSGSADVAPFGGCLVTLEFCHLFWLLPLGA
jgi:hypothetical protein